jgi:hypothetical protein
VNPVLYLRILGKLYAKSEKPHAHSKTLRRILRTLAFGLTPRDPLALGIDQTVSIYELKLVVRIIASLSLPYSELV